VPDRSRCGRRYSGLLAQIAEGGSDLDADDLGAGERGRGFGGGGGV
jgi:hypothetical protein